MGGIIALVGSGEFTPAMDGVDRALLEATGGSRPRVAIVPTASWPDGGDVFERWAAMGEAHFGALGADPRTVRLTDLDSAGDPAIVEAIAGADLVYLSGGKPGHLLATLRETPAGDALRTASAAGVVVAGCSAGAMVLGGDQLRVGGRQLRVGGRRLLRLPVGWDDALGLVPGIVVIPHYDAVPEALMVPVALAAPAGTVLVGIDEDTAAVGRQGAWQVHGRGRVTVWRGRHRERHREGGIARF